MVVIKYQKIRKMNDSLKTFFIIGRITKIIHLSMIFTFNNKSDKSLTTNKILFYF